MESELQQKVEQLIENEIVDGFVMYDTGAVSIAEIYSKKIINLCIDYVDQQIEKNVNGYQDPQRCEGIIDCQELVKSLKVKT